MTDATSRDVVSCPLCPTGTLRVVNAIYAKCGHCGQEVRRDEVDL
ncbi:hypothetical protein [Halobellus inordinatus]|nr:hypothetical protein [Halobellus inordinatus]